MLILHDSQLDIMRGKIYFRKKLLLKMQIKKLIKFSGIIMSLNWHIYLNLLLSNYFYFKKFYHNTTIHMKIGIIKKNI